MAIAEKMSAGIQGAEIWINYLSSNNRITNVEWALPSGVITRCRIWNDTVSPDVPIYDQVFYGPDSGNQHVPGNHRMAEVTESGETFMALPDYLVVQFNTEILG